MFTLMQVDADERFLVTAWRHLPAHRKDELWCFARRQIAAAVRDETPPGASCNPVAIDGSGAYAALPETPGRAANAADADCAGPNKN